MICYTFINMKKRGNKNKKITTVEVITERLCRSKTFTQKFADAMTKSFGTATFLVFNAGLFALWIAVNRGWIQGFPIFDPYPYGLLTMIVSLEAIFLSVIVLISQNREAQITAMRDEIDFQVNLNAEKEITQILKGLENVENKLHIVHRNTREIEKMKEVLDLDSISLAVEKAMQKSKSTK